MINNKTHLIIIDYCAVITCNIKEEIDNQIIIITFVNSQQEPTINRQNRNSPSE